MTHHDDNSPPVFVRWADGSLTTGDVCEVVPDEQRTDGERDEIEVIASTERVATDGDVIEAATWRTGAYSRVLRRGGPILADHDRTRLIGCSVRTKIDAEAGTLRAWYRHRTSDSPDVIEARARRAEGLLMPVSVRWAPGRVVPADQLPKDHRLYRDRPVKVETPFGTYERMPRVHRYSMLREISETVIPADPGALAVRSVTRSAAADLGIDPGADSLEDRIRDAVAAMIERGEFSPALADAISAIQAALPRVSIDKQVWG